MGKNPVSYKFRKISITLLGIIIAVFKNAQTDHQILERSILYEGSDSSMTQNILPTKKLEIGKAYTIDELISRMIIFSDNEAHNLLARNIDNDIFNQVFIDLGVAT